MCDCGSGRDEEPSGENVPPPDSDPFSEAEFGKNSIDCQRNSQGRITDSSSTSAPDFHPQALQIASGRQREFAMSFARRASREI